MVDFCGHPPQDAAHGIERTCTSAHFGGNPSGMDPPNHPGTHRLRKGAVLTGGGPGVIFIPVPEDQYPAPRPDEPMGADLLLWMDHSSVTSGGAVAITQPGGHMT